MKLFLFNTGFPDNKNKSSGIFSYRTAISLSKYFDVTVIHFRSFDFRRKLITSERFGELDVFRIALPQIPSNGNIFLMKINIFLYKILGYKILKEIIKDGDIFHSTGIIITSLIIDSWSKKLNKLHICQGIGDDVNIYLSSFVKSKYWTKRLKDLRHIQFNSFALKNLYQKLLGYSDGYYVNYRGVDTNKFKFLSRKIEKKILKFIFLGGVQTYDIENETLLNTKGSHILKSAWENFSRNKKNVVLFYGGPGINKKQFYNWSNKLEFPENIKFIGKILPENVCSYLNKADVLIIPSINEGLPNLANEALSSGLPVLSSNAGGLPEIVFHKINGFVVEKNSAESLESGLNWFYNNKDLISQLGENGSKYVKKNRSWNNFADKLKNKIKSQANYL